jgi:ribonuclease BN (tRNA processing enzyme)
VQTVLRRDIVELIPGEMAQDILEYHSGVVEAAQTAARVGAKRLALTHMVPAPTPDHIRNGSLGPPSTTTAT